MMRDTKRDTMSESNESEKSENQTSEFSEEELEKAVDKITNDLGYYVTFRVGMADEHIEDDSARAEISTEILYVLERLSKQYKGLTLDYNFGYELRNQVPIELIG
jgi:hypothetical protein